MSYSESSNLVLVFNAVGIPFRLLTGWVVDRFVGPLNGTIPRCLLNGLLAFAWIGVKSRTGMYIFTSVNGLNAGAFQALFATTVTCLNNDMTKNGVILGMVFLVFSFVGLLSPPIDGVLLETNSGGLGGYHSAFITSGVSSLIGICLIIGARIRHGGTELRHKC